MGFNTSVLLGIAFGIVFSGIISLAVAFTLRRTMPLMAMSLAVTLSAVAGTAAMVALGFAITTRNSSAREWLAIWTFEDLMGLALMFASSTATAGLVLRKAKSKVDPRTFD
jgi:hypothetical protein